MRYCHFHGNKSTKVTWLHTNEYSDHLFPDRAVCWSLLAYAIGNMSLTGITLSLNGTASLEPNSTETQAALNGEKTVLTHFEQYCYIKDMFELSVSKYVLNVA